MTRALRGYLALAVCVAAGAGCAAESEPEASEQASAGKGSSGGAKGGEPSALGSAGTAPSGGMAGAASTGKAGAGSAGTASAGASTSGGAPSGAAGKPGASGEAGSTNGGAAGGAACPAAPIAPGTTPLIDDFNHLGRSIPTNEGRSGVWDVWSLLPSADMSPKSANYQTTDAESDGYTHWTGKDIGGTNDWGPTLTVQLSAGCPYDASAYSGISFKLKGTATKLSGASAVPLKIMLWQPQGVPAKDAKGGACAAVACYNHYSAFVNVPLIWDTPENVPSHRERRSADRPRSTWRCHAGSAAG